MCDTCQAYSQPAISGCLPEGNNITLICSYQINCILTGSSITLLGNELDTEGHGKSYREKGGTGDYHENQIEYSGSFQISSKCPNDVTKDSPHGKQVLRVTATLTPS